jgi:hypothetical protein
MDPRTNAFILEYRRQREGLLAEFPELAEDIDTLADTLEGISMAPDLIAEFIRNAREDEANAEALASMMRDMADRKQRFIARADKRRQAAMNVMNAIEMRKLEMPDFTASIRVVPPKVEIINDTLLPDELCKFVRTPDRTAIKEALANGPLAGAHMSNGSETLTIRTK